MVAFCRRIDNSGIVQLGFQHTESRARFLGTCIPYPAIRLSFRYQEYYLQLRFHANERVRASYHYWQLARRNIVTSNYLLSHYQIILDDFNQIDRR